MYLKKYLSTWILGKKAKIFNTIFQKNKISAKNFMLANRMPGRETNVDDYGVSLRTKISLKKRIDLLGEINSEIENVWSNK